MKKATIYICAFIMLSGALTSCKKVYECECTTPTGTPIKETIEANNRNEAQKNCSDLSRISSCEIK